MNHSSGGFWSTRKPQVSLPKSILVGGTCQCNVNSLELLARLRSLYPLEPNDKRGNCLYCSLAVGENLYPLVWSCRWSTIEQSVHEILEPCIRYGFNWKCEESDCMHSDDSISFVCHIKITTSCPIASGNVSIQEN